MKNITTRVKYEVIELIAEGGMGKVIKAREKGIEGFEKIVAIKKLLPKYSRDRRFVRMFVKEAKIVANLVHENIVQIYQLNKTRREYYIAMEYVDGISLHQMILFHNKTNQRFPVNLAIFIASRVARGLVYAHNRRDSNGEPLDIVHCDICPHNVLINTEGVAKITDFGIARARSISASELDTAFAGKVLFMSPEQAAQKKMDFHSDIYSLGMLLFFTLTGKSGRENGSGELKDIVARAIANEISWEDLPPDLDKDVLSILHKMLAMKPSDRYLNTAELAQALEYHIYKNGYGPTIVTLADYLRAQMPGLFDLNSGNPLLPQTGDYTIVLEEFQDMKPKAKTEVKTEVETEVETEAKLEPVVEESWWRKMVDRWTK